MTSKPDPARPLSYRRLFGGAVVAAAVGAAVNALLYFLGRLVGAFPPTLLVRGEPFNVMPFVTLTLTSVLVAAGVFALLARFVGRPLRVFWFVAAAVLVLMFVTPFTLLDAPVSTVVILELTHVVAAAAAVWAVRRAYVKRSSLRNPDAEHRPDRNPP